MFKRSALIALFGLLLLGLFGCIEQNDYSSGNTVTLSARKAVDLENDGITDLYIYDLAQQKIKGTDYEIKKKVVVAVESSASYTDYAKLTDLNVVMIESDLENFEKTKNQVIESCEQKIGLTNVNCIDAKTCSKLCAATSGQCKKIANSYEDALGGAMITFIRDETDIKNAYSDIKKIATRLGNNNKEDKDNYLTNTRKIVYKIASLYSNPLGSSQEIGLCTLDNFGAENLKITTDMIGNYTVKQQGYKYVVTVFIQGKQNSSDGAGTVGITVRDYLPSESTKDVNAITSYQQISAKQAGAEYIVELESNKASGNAYLLVYEFYSSQPPDAMIAKMKDTGLSVKKINFLFLMPVDFLFTLLNNILNNYYLAFGASFAVATIIILLVYNFITLVYHIARAALNKEKLMLGVKRAIGKTEVRWKMDIIASILLIAVAFYISTSMLSKPATTPMLLESFDFLKNNPVGVFDIAAAFMGVILLFTAIENRIKITVLENAYGVVIKEEKDLFIARSKQLLDKLKELDNAIKQYSAEEFDVSSEYDVLAAVSKERVEEISKNINPRNKRLLDDYLTKVESALEQLNERKKTANENWEKWKEMMDKMMVEHDEIYISTLITIPSSLRNWAVGKYAKERAAEGVVLDRDVIRKKKIEPEKVIEALIKKGFMSSVVVVKDEKVLLAKTSKGSATISKALTLKLLDYTKSLGKSLGQQDWASFAAVGEKYVLVLMKEQNMQCSLIVPREQFTESIRLFRIKIKAFEQ
jgi:hypothetical protein